MPLPMPVEPSFSRCCSDLEDLALALSGELGGARRELLDRLLLVVDLERGNDRLRRNEIGERHVNGVRGRAAQTKAQRAADHREEANGRQ